MVLTFYIVSHYASREDKRTTLGRKSSFPSKPPLQLSVASYYFSVVNVVMYARHEKRLSDVWVSVINGLLQMTVVEKASNYS